MQPLARKGVLTRDEFLTELMRIKTEMGDERVSTWNTDFQNIDPLPIANSARGTLSPLFVAVLGAGSYAYAEATHDQQL